LFEEGVRSLIEEILRNWTAAALSLSLSLSAPSGEIEESKNPFLGVAVAISFGALHLLGEELKNCRSRDCQRRGKRRRKRKSLQVGEET
jgi:hypothetical protein